MLRAAGRDTSLCAVSRCIHHLVDWPSSVDVSAASSARIQRFEDISGGRDDACSPDHRRDGNRRPEKLFPCKADRVILLRISVVEDARKSYIPSGIDVGIVLGKAGLPCAPPEYWLHHYANLKDRNMGWK